MTTATEILLTDQEPMVTTKTLAEKLVMTTHSLPCKTMAGAHVISLTVLQLALTTSETTMTAETLKEFLSEEAGLMPCIATTSTLPEISRLLMTNNITWSTENLTNSSSRATTWSTEPSRSSATMMPISCFLRDPMVKERPMRLSSVAGRTPSLSSEKEFKALKSQLEMVQFAHRANL